MKLNNISWGAVGVICSYQLIAIIGLPFYLYYFTPPLSLILIAFILFILTGIGITAGYHRFYAHRAYKLNKVTELIMLFFATLALQSSALAWACNHRIHHKFTDQPEDPYSVKKGFWHAHIFWLFNKSKPIDSTLVPDLIQNKLVMFQHKYYYALGILSNILICGSIGFLLGDFVGAFFFAGLVRIVLLHHVTFSINSLAHTWGQRTICREISAVDNYTIAILTFGEGYHNYHHAFPADYRNGVKWYHFDPGKWTVWSLNKLGLATELKKIDQCTVKKRIINEDKHIFLKRLHASKKKEQLEILICEKSHQLTERLQQLRQLIHTQQEKHHIKALENSIKQDWKEWNLLIKNIQQESKTQQLL